MSSRRFHFIPRKSCSGLRMFSFVCFRLRAKNAREKASGACTLFMEDRCFRTDGIIASLSQHARVEAFFLCLFSLFMLFLISILISISGHCVVPMI